VHEHGWAIKRETGGGLEWFRPDGRRHVGGPAPPGPDDATPERLGA